MEKAILKPAMVKTAAGNVGSFAELARRINRKYRTLLLYRAQCEAPADVVASIEKIAKEIPSNGT